MIRDRTVAGSCALIVVASACSCGGLLSNSGDEPDGSVDTGRLPDAGTEGVGSSEAGPKDAADDLARDGAAPDAATCGALGDTCCGGTSCDGSLICSAGRCSCQSNSNCPDDGTCTSSGQCLVTISGGSAQFYTNSIALDGVSVYWANGGSGSFGAIVKAPLTGGEPHTLSSSLMRPVSLVEGGGFLYWFELKPTLGIIRQGVGGAGLASVVSGESSNAASLVVDGTDVYWTVNTIGASVQKVALTGGMPSTLIAEQTAPTFLALSASDVYWTDTYGLHAISKAGGKPRIITGACPYDCTCADAAFVVDSTNAYCLQPYRGVLEVALATGAITTLVGAPDAMSYPSGIFPEEIAIDADAVYWVSDEGLMSVPKAGGATTTLSTQGGTAIAVNDTSVYWATGTSEGKILMLSPK